MTVQLVALRLCLYRNARTCTFLFPSLPLHNMYIRYPDWKKCTYSILLVRDELAKSSNIEAFISAATQLWLCFWCCFVFSTVSVQNLIFTGATTSMQSSELRTETCSWSLSRFCSCTNWSRLSSAYAIKHDWRVHCALVWLVLFFCYFFSWLIAWLIDW